MRQRFIKNLWEKMEPYEDFLVHEPEERRGIWRDSFDGNGVNNPSEEIEEFCVEIGCGKGQFVTTLAERNPKNRYLAIEGHPSVSYHAVQKMSNKELPNIKLLIQYIKDAKEIFEENEIDRMYLNFSDPWPKAKHEKRRLTTGNNLLDYAHVVKKGGIIEFKTDNDGLFEYSMEQIESRPELEVLMVTRDLHRDVPLEQIVTTEYEDKFSAKGKNINFVRMRVKI